MLYTAFILSLWSALLSAASLATQLLYRAGKISIHAVNASATGASSRPINIAAIAALSAILFFAPVGTSVVLACLRIKNIGRIERMVAASFALNAFSLAYGVFAITVFAR